MREQKTPYVLYDKSRNYKEEAPFDFKTRVVETSEVHLRCLNFLDIPLYGVDPMARYVID